MVKGIETKTGIEAVKEAKKYFGKKPDLVITDVPTKTLSQFKKLAEEDFKPEKGSAHYGFTLKHILDFYCGLINEHSQIVEAKASDALERIEKLEEEFESANGTKEEEKDQKVKKMLDGTERRCF